MVVVFTTTTESKLHKPGKDIGVRSGTKEVEKDSSSLLVRAIKKAAFAKLGLQLGRQALATQEAWLFLVLYLPPRGQLVPF